MNKLFIVLLFAPLAFLPVGLSAVVLSEIDFDGAFADDVAGNDSQITSNAAVTYFNSGTEAYRFRALGSWVYSDIGGTTVAVNDDLRNSGIFTSTTRIEGLLHNAAPGETYTITSIEIDVLTANNNTFWDFGYRTSAGVDTLISGVEIASQSAGDGITTYAITGLDLTATDSGRDWNTSVGLRLIFHEPDGTNSDNLGIAAIRFVGTSSVVPEISTYAFISGSIFLIVAMIARRKNDC